MQSANGKLSEEAATSHPPPRKRSFEIKPSGSWKQLVGWNKDCTLQQEALKLGAEWRARENRREK